MLNDAAKADRAAFLRIEQRRTFKERAGVALDTLRRRLRVEKGACFLRTRRADGLLYVAVRAGGVSADE